MKTMNELTNCIKNGIVAALANYEYDANIHIWKSPYHNDMEFESSEIEDHAYQCAICCADMVEFEIKKAIGFDFLMSCKYYKIEATYYRHGTIRIVIFIDYTKEGEYSYFENIDTI